MSGWIDKAATGNGPRFVISGGGTGGHIFPALAVAEALLAARPDADIRFVGASGRMEMERVPAAGFPIEGLGISGLQRRLTLDNLSFPLKVIRSVLRANKLLRAFKPHAAVGTGGYASGPLLYAATKQGIPTLIQEQNAYAGLTNKLLARWVNRICVAYPAMEQFFPAEKLVQTGNPIREDFERAAPATAAERGELRRAFGLEPDRPTLLVTGGSLGARTLNEALLNATATLAAAEVQVIWQCGGGYADRCEKSETAALPNVVCRPFLDPMIDAYRAADLIVCRAGALTIAELLALGKPALLVPSPNVAEDHQTKNALALTGRDAARMLPDGEAAEQLLPTALALLARPEELNELSAAARSLAQRGAAQRIAEEVLGMIE
ncbi:MAG: undecaprenyldiphospho-muramoylpentapeptide beta-N-acetylglucosaminyltransferase [Saprospiraceae bacterium]